MDSNWANAGRWVDDARKTKENRAKQKAEKAGAGEMRRLRSATPAVSRWVVAGVDVVVAIVGVVVGAIFVPIAVAVAGTVAVAVADAAAVAVAGAVSRRC